MKGFDWEMGTQAREAYDKLSWWQKFLLESGSKIYVGEETREGWSGYIPFYIFRSNCCGRVVKDYPHGYLDRQYILCLHCDGAHHDFVPWWIPFKQMWDLLRMRLSSRN